MSDTHSLAEATAFLTVTEMANDVALDAAVGMEALLKTIPVEPTTQNMALIDASVNSLMRPFGLEHTHSEVGIEGLGKNILAAIWKTLLDVIVGAWNAIVRFVKEIIDGTSRLNNAAKKLQKAAAGSKGVPVAEVLPVSNYDLLANNGVLVGLTREGVGRIYADTLLMPVMVAKITTASKSFSANYSRYSPDMTEVEQATLKLDIAKEAEQYQKQMIEAAGGVELTADVRFKDRSKKYYGVVSENNPGSVMPVYAIGAGETLGTLVVPSPLPNPKPSSPTHPALTAAEIQSLCEPIQLSCGGILDSRKLQKDVEKTSKQMRKVGDVLVKNVGNTQNQTLAADVRNAITKINLCDSNIRRVMPALLKHYLSTLKATYGFCVRSYKNLSVDT